MSCCPLNACYLAVAVLSAVQCPLLKTVGSPLLDGLASGVCALLGGSGAVTNACNCLTAANAPGACGSGCTDSSGIGPGYALYTPLSNILGGVAKLAGESVCPGTTGYYCPTGQTCKTRTGSAPYCCNDSTDCYNSLGKCADTSWQQYRVTIGASTSNFCCGNGTIGVYQSTGQDSVGICATARPAFYTTVSAISSGSCSYSTSSTVLSFTLSASTSTSTSSSSSSSQSSTLFDNSIVRLTDIIGVFQCSVLESTSTTEITQPLTSSLSTVSSSTSSSMISTSASVSANLPFTSLISPETSISSSFVNQNTPSVSESSTSTTSSSSSIYSPDISQSQSQQQSQSSSIDSTSSSQSSFDISSFLSSTFIDPITIQSSVLTETESTSSTSTSALAEAPAEPCDASLC
ncbi:hypothetical protein BOTCAL_0029g00030 [Botryotinia calthae]|uniref:Hydrophobin n=1 Tax=Botryotinia calthae TaxID=38488 RepID=A0A4Y8DG48_9HELO|nr:hypothetical protein BOTCAL_0029g00030 [Botryotinia calthae]